MRSVLALWDLANWLKLQIALDILSVCTLAGVKLSALFFYRRIFCVSVRKATFAIVTMTTAVIILLWLVTFCFLTGFQYHSHISALWDGTRLKYCTISFPFLEGLVISDFLLDVWILALPFPEASILPKLLTSGSLTNKNIIRF